MRHPLAALKRCISSQAAREVSHDESTIVEYRWVLFLLLPRSAGCVSYGNTHALITPLGVAGYHKFRPQNTALVCPPPPIADRMTAAANGAKCTSAETDD